MYKFLTTPLTISGVYKDAWRLYKTIFWYVLAWSLILAVIHVIPYLFKFVGFYKQEVTGHLTFSWVGLLGFLVLLLADTYFLAVLIYSIYSSATEQKIDNLKAFNLAKSQLLTLYFSLLIYFLAVLVGVVLLIVPAIFIGILFSMVPLYIVIDKLKLYQSFESSVRLVWGAWWQTFFILVIPYALTYFIRSLIKVVPHHDWPVIVDIVLLTLLMPYFYAVLVIQFNNLKIIKSLPEPLTQQPRTQSQ